MADQAVHNPNYIIAGKIPAVYLHNPVPVFFSVFRQLMPDLGRQQDVVIPGLYLINLRKAYGVYDNRNAGPIQSVLHRIGKVGRGKS